MGCSSFKTYVFRGVLSNRLSLLRSVMLMPTVRDDCAQVGSEGEASEELHAVKDGHRDGLGPVGILTPPTTLN